MRAIVISLTIFISGVVLNRFMSASGYMTHFLPILLGGLMVTVGFDIGTEESYLEQLKTHSVKVFLLPVLVIIGSLSGATIAATLLHTISLRDGLLISSGLGYYSLSSVLISAQYSSFVGTIALLSNILRETTTLLLAPVLVRFFGRMSVIASGAATSMDVCLPVIRKYAGTETVYPAFVTGFVLTLSVPLLISLLLRL